MISFAVTAYNETVRPQNRPRILECIRTAQQHDAIGEIVVVDDGSEDYDRLAELLDGQPKVRLYHNPTNRGVFGNKLEAIARATGEWVITCDSDNRMDRNFIDWIAGCLNKKPDTWYCPSFAREDFDYRGLIGNYDVGEIARILHQPMFRCCANTGNQTVHRDSFMEVFGAYRDKRADLMMVNWLELPEDVRKEHHWRLVFDACDSFIFNLGWLVAGNRLCIGEGLEYQHYRTNGAESNYARAPADKGKLEAMLFSVLEMETKQWTP